LRKELEDRISSLLTDAQRPSFAAIRERFADSGGRQSQSARIFVLGSDRKPKPTAIRIGVTDGAQTEVLSGLEDGTEVIVGGGPRTEPAARAPRFGF
jgi:HlyD family secretion protein